MRKLGLCVVLVLIVGCSTPDRHHDLRKPDPVNATSADGVFALLMHVIYCLGIWLGPRT